MYGLKIWDWTANGPVLIFLETGPYDSPDWTEPWDRTSVQYQISGLDYLQISPVQSGPSPTVRSQSHSPVRSVYV